MYSLPTAWAGIKDQSVTANQDETGIISPSFRIPGSDLITAEFTGNESDPITWIPSGSSNHAPFNLSLHGVVLRPRDTVASNTKLRYVIIDDANNKEV